MSTPEERDQNDSAPARPWWYAHLDPEATAEQCWHDFERAVIRGVAEMITQDDLRGGGHVSNPEQDATTGNDNGRPAMQDSTTVALEQAAARWAWDYVRTLVQENPAITGQEIADKLHADAMESLQI